jgi:hypothetical protein
VVGQPRMVAEWLVHVAIAPPLCPNGVVIELNRQVVEGKGGKKGGGDWPATNLRLTGHVAGWEICHETMIALPCLGESLVRKLLEAHPWTHSVTLLADLSDEKSQKSCRDKS